MVAGVRRNGAVWPHHAQRTAERRQHTCSALLPCQRIGSEVGAMCLRSDKIKYKYGRTVAYSLYIDLGYGMWLSLAIKIMALPTQLQLHLDAGQPADEGQC
jgi:hypothetical protein